MTLNNSWSVIYVSKQKIEWENEVQTMVRFPDLKNLHKSDTFIKPWDWQIEHCHRYWIGKEMFCKKSLKWPLWGKFMKVAFKNVPITQHKPALITMILAITLYTICILGCFTWGIVVLFTSLNPYQKSLNIIGAVVSGIFWTMILSKSIYVSKSITIV